MRKRGSRWTWSRGFLLFSAFGGTSQALGPSKADSGWNAGHKKTLGVQDPFPSGLCYFSWQVTRDYPYAAHSYEVMFFFFCKTLRQKIHNVGRNQIMPLQRPRRCWHSASIELLDIQFDDLFALEKNLRYLFRNEKTCAIEKFVLFFAL